MCAFVINGDEWSVRFVDGASEALVDRTWTLRLATTDPSTMTVYVSDRLSGDLLKRVVVHEIGHCIMHSYGLIESLHRMVKRRYWVEAEEWVCNILAEYGELALDRAEKVLGSHGIVAVPQEMERLFT